MNKEAKKQLALLRASYKKELSECADVTVDFKDQMREIAALGAQHEEHLRKLGYWRAESSSLDLLWTYRGSSTELVIARLMLSS